ncbi:MAG: hypothetical protein J3K34DRAFT_516042 [Monoraphidium minutum]|nr:MAG: hypothetical protein J3K34DRAFT_516042 [Monoraphidium minutum]
MSRARAPLPLRAAKRTAAGDTRACSPAPAHEPLVISLRRAVAGAAAAAAAALAGLLPAGAAAALDALPPLDAPAALDPELLDVATPELVEVMFFVVATYVGLMLMYLWLASMIDEEEADANASRGAGGGSAGAQPPPPPSYDGYQTANIRSVREPRRGHALVAPPLPDDGGWGGGGGGAITGLKASLAAQAADFPLIRCPCAAARRRPPRRRECGSVVRRKLYLRRLAAQDAARSPGGGGPAPACGSRSHLSDLSPADAGALLLAQPGQLELMVDEALDCMPPDVVAAADGEDALVRSITAAVAQRLAAAEAGELMWSMRLAVDERRGKGKGAPSAAGLGGWSRDKMARSVCFLVVAALVVYAGVAAAVPAVKITVRWDNTAREVVQQAEPETRRNLAQILCGRISEANVVLPQEGTADLVDSSILVDSSTTAVYYCKSEDGTQEGAARIFAACENEENKDEFDDEMEDDTDFPELEVEQITCDPAFVDIP